MVLKKYGVLKGTVVGHLRDADDDHWTMVGFRTSTRPAW